MANTSKNTNRKSASRVPMAVRWPGRIAAASGACH
ncbi:arylsulfatase A-like enzyme [Massilia sp. UYP11]